MGNAPSATRGDAMDVDAPSRSPQPRLTEFFHAVPGRDPRWNRTQLRSKVPVEMLKRIVDFALGPPCLCETRVFSRVPTHERSCDCLSCGCNCYEMIHLASQLSRVSFVFHELAGGRVWHYIYIGGYQTNRFYKLLNHLDGRPERRTAILDRVGMCRIEFPEETDEDAHEARVMRLAGALASMPKLVSLEISLYWGVCGASKLLEASSCPGRRSLKLNGVAFSGHSLRSCLRALHQLQTLRVCGAVTEDSEVLDALAEAAPSSLESLIVNRDTAYEDETEDLETALEDRHLSQIVDSVRNLKVLDLDQCAKLTDASFGPAFGKFLELAEVRLKFCSKVTDATLLKLASPCLRELVLDSAVGVGDASIVPILRQNTHIEWLNLRKTGVTDAIVPHLHASRSTINDLNLSRTSVTWSALKPLIEADPPLLEYLAVSYLAGVDDDAVLCIREHLKELVALRLAGCGGIRKAETLLYTVFRLKGTLDTLCVRDVPVADGEN